MPRRLALAAVLSLAAGCAATGGGSLENGNARVGDGRPDVDPERAYLPLSELEPAVDVPSRPPGSAEPAPLSQRAARQLAEARGLVAEERYTEASLALERALRYEPNHPEVHRALAALHAEAGNIQRAETHARRALDINPDDVTAHYVLGRCAAFHEDRSGAIAAYRTALRCSDVAEHPRVAALCAYELGVALGTEGYLTAALEAYALFETKVSGTDAVSAPAPAEQQTLQALRQSRQIPLADARGRIFERLGRYREAAEQACAAAGAARDDTDRAIRCGELWLAAGRPQEALRVARGIKPNAAPVLDLLARSHEQLGQPEAVLDDLRDRLARSPTDAAVVRFLADTLARFGRDKEAGDALETYLARVPDAEDVRLRLIDLLLARKTWMAALRQCAAGIRAQPARATVFEEKAQSLASDSVAVEAVLSGGAGAGGEGARDDGPVVTYLRGLVAVAAQRSASGLELLREAHQADPQFVPARAALARAYLNQFEYAKALEVAGRLEEETIEVARLERVLGDVYERLDDLPQAELHYKAAIQHDRDDAASMLALSEVLARAGEDGRARLQLTVLLDRFPGHEEARETLAEMLLRERRVDAAVEEYQELKRRTANPATAARCDAILTLLRQQDVVAFRRALQESIERHGPDGRTWRLLAEHYGDFEEEYARDAYEQAVALDSQDEAALLGLVRAEERLLAYESAAARLEALLPRRPNQSAWRLTLLDLYLRIEAYDKALALGQQEEGREDLDEEKRRRYRGWIVRALKGLGRQADALAQLTSWHQAEPLDREAALRLAQEYIEQERPADAAAICETLHRSDPQDAGLLRPVLAALTLAESYDRAAQYVLARLSEDPDDEAALADLVSVLVSAGRSDDALELIDNRLLVTRRRELFQNLALSVLRDAKRYDAALERTESLIDEAVSLLRDVAERGGQAALEPVTDVRRLRRPDEHSIDALHERIEELETSAAQTLLLAQRQREAEMRIRKRLSATHDPNVQLRLLLLLSASLQFQGRAEEATAVAEQALAARPDDVRLNNDVAYGWIDRGIRLDEAERRIRFALSREPYEGAYLDTYGWLMYKKGAFAEAKKWLLRSRHRLDTGDAVVLDHLGDAQWRLGEKEAALASWSEAVELAKGEPDAGEQQEAALSPDEQRVLTETPVKIEEARAGREPKTAALAPPPEPDA